jgi:hypothetical protein
VRDPKWILGQSPKTLKNQVLTLWPVGTLVAMYKGKMVNVLVLIILSLVVTKSIVCHADDTPTLRPVSAVLPQDRITIFALKINQYAPSNMGSFSSNNSNTITFDKLNAIGLDPSASPSLSQFETGVASKISEDILNSDSFRKSSLGQATTEVEKYSQTSIFTMNFQVKVAEKEAVLTYKGQINSEVMYVGGQNNIKWVLSKPLDNTTNLAWTNTAGLGSTSSSIFSLRHSF